MIHQAEDKIFKLITEEWKEEFGEIFNISLKDYKPIPTELIGMGYSKHIDAGWEGKDKIITMEFQSKTPNTDDQLRFSHYGIMIFEKFGKPAEIYVICTPEIKNPQNLKSVTTPFFKIKYIHFKNIDGDKKLNNIRNKIKNEEKLNNNDIVELLLIPLMGTKYNTAIQLEKTIKLTNKITIKDRRQLKKIKVIQIFEVNKFIKDSEKLAELMGEITMSTDVWEVYDEQITKKARIEAENKGIEKGVKKGKEETKIEFAKRMLSENIPTDKIMRITSLTRDDINSLR